MTKVHCSGSLIIIIKCLISPSKYYYQQLVYSNSYSKEAHVPPCHKVKR